MIQGTYSSTKQSLGIKYKHQPENVLFHLHDIRQNLQIWKTHILKDTYNKHTTTSQPQHTQWSNFHTWGRAGLTQNLPLPYGKIERLFEKDKSTKFDLAHEMDWLSSPVRELSYVDVCFGEI